MQYIKCSSLVGYAGGVVGTSNASVVNCYNTSTVDFTCTFAGTNTTAYAGNMGNLLATNKSIENCFNSGTILGNNHIAGIAGYITE